MTPTSVAPRVNRVRACSACPGDYEDPEQSAWRDASDEDDAEAPADFAEPSAPQQRFPVREE